MKYFTILALFFCVYSIVNIAAQDAVCRYFIYDSAWKYSCGLSVNNSLEYDGYTEINGQHLNAYTDDIVQGISKVRNTIVFPSIVCRKFKNLFWIDLFAAGLEIVEENAFNNCTNLEWLSFKSNKIQKLHENLFANQLKLKTLYLNRNEIEELPPNIFKNLVNLEQLWLDDNKLTTVHSSSFGLHPKLKDLTFSNNNLESVDEKIFTNNAAIRKTMAGPNPCGDYDDWFTDTTPTRRLIKAAFQRCFDKYVVIEVSTRSSLIDEIQSEIQLENEQINSLKRENAELQAKVQQLKSELENLE